MKTDEQLKAENQAIRDMLAAGLGERLRSVPGVVHVSVGLKETHGQATAQLAIRVYVREKRSPEDIPPGELIPAEINGVPTDVNVVAGSFEFQLDNTRYRPIKGGIQVTNRIIDINDAGTGTQMSRGTLGCIAVDNTDNAPVLLSNWHVLCANGARNGMDKVFQPAPTALPPLDITQLPFRPEDDNDKIGVLRRNAITSKVDAAIAAIDVSSCCHCCGIHYTNALNGLSVGGRPARNTIVGDEKAVSGMTVFKVGQSTLRSEGVVVDDDYPSFTITKSGTSYTFDGQIAIQNVDPAVPFSNHGDSGSALINLNNKIVGLVFAAKKDVLPNGTEENFISLANHIDDVFTALNIHIEYSPDVVTVAGEVLTNQPYRVFEAPIPQPYQALRERLRSRENTAWLFDVGVRHSEEVLYLVNNLRHVTATWYRCEGPALAATVMSAVRDGHYRIPETVKGVALHEALEQMRAVLSKNGSPELTKTMESPTARLLIEASKGCTDLNELIERLAADPVLHSLLQGEPI